MEKNESRVFPILIAAVVLCGTVALSRGPDRQPPGARAAGIEGQEGAHAAMCEEHDLSEAECGICHPDLAADLAPGSGLKIRFPSAESASTAGIQVTRPSTERLPDGVECYGEIAFDQNRTAHVVSPVGGVLDEVRADLGHRVRAGEVLAIMASGSIAESQGDYIRARTEWKLSEAAHERERRLHTDRISPEKDVQEAAAARDAARAVLQQAEKRLRILGLTALQISDLGTAPDGGSGLLEIRSPISGEVIDRAAVRGVQIEAGKTLFVVADPSVMWGMNHVPERELARVRPGQRVEFTTDGGAGDTIEGKLAWLSAEVDPRSRMASGRAEIRNGAHPVRSGSFARAWIETGAGDPAIVVPEDAVQRVDNKPFVFVRLADDLFEARAVTLGARRDGRVAVREGLRAEDEIVVARSYVVKSEFLKSRLGAGCVED